MNASYIAMCVTRFPIYFHLEMNACMNGYLWLICAFVQLHTFHFVFNGNHLLRLATAKFNFQSWFFEGFVIGRILKKWVHIIQMLSLLDL